jgi:anaerobic selenocysteine-containing dehydrogenase
MALINVIVSEDIYNHDFVERWCYGFDEMAKAVEGMTPEEAGRICDVDPEVIRQVARLFATESPGTVQWGLSLEQNPGSMGANIGILDLLAICGYIDCPGGAILVRDAYGLPHHVGEGYCPPENLALRCQKPGPGAIWGETRQMYWDWEKHEVARIRMLIIESCNTLANTAGDAPRIFDDMKELDFVVGIEPFLSPTITAFADIVLPVSMSIERDSIRAWWTPLRFTAKIAQYYEAKSDEDIAIEITNRLYPDRLDDIKSAKDLQNWRLSGRDELRSTGASIDEAKGNAGGTFSILQNAQVFSNERWDDRIDFDGFKKLGYSYDNFNATYYKYEKGMLRDDLQPGFKTTTGRIELYSLSYRAWGIPPVPDFVSPEIDASQEYPLIMTSGVRSWEFFHSEHRQLPTMREFHPWPQVMMNENVAREFGVREGAWVWIANEQGRFMQKAHIVPNGFLKDNNITVEHGWWYPEDDPAEPVLCRTFDSNPNNCIDIDRVGPYGIGSYTKCTPVTLYPVKEDDVTPTQQIVEMGGFPPQKARKIARESDWEARGVVSN